MKKIIFCGLARDCAPALPFVLENIKQLARHFSEVAYLFVENDSRDSTKQILHGFRQWTEGHRFELMLLDGLANISVRTLRLEVIRNAYIQFIRDDDQLRDFDLLVVLDMDDAAVHPVDFHNLEAAIDFLYASESHAGVFANQAGTYYDMWALRHNQLCPGDVWEEVLDYAVAHGVTDELAYDATFKKRILSIDTNSDPIRVDSAFGGLAIYKLPFVLDNPNPYLGSKVKFIPGVNGNRVLARWQTCEHVHFNRGIGTLGGQLFIYPSLVNGVNGGLQFSPSAFRQLLF